MIDTLFEDAKLADNISFNPWRPLPIKGIFLTGATGFFGRFLLRALLEHTTVTIYCLVRAENQTQAQEKLTNVLMTLKYDYSKTVNRIIPILGDLSQPHLGLSESNWQALASTCDCIIHNGAKVNLSLSYQQLRMINVLGTKTIIELAASCHTKPIHFISSVAVAFDNNTLEQPIAEIPLSQPPQTGGYRQSKWVAEHLLQSARAQGLAVNIYRLSRIIGDSHTGLGINATDLIYRMVIASLQLKAYPKLDISLNLIPADYASWAIVYISQQIDCLTKHLGQELHIIHPKPIAWQDFMNLIKEAENNIAVVDAKQWRVMLDHAYVQHPKNKLYASLKLANRLHEPKPEFTYQNMRTCLEASTIQCPSIDKGLVSRYITQWQNYYYNATH